MFTPGPLRHKSETMYLPMPYMRLKYPRLARSVLENRAPVAQRLHHHASWNTKAALSEDRTFRPQFLNYLVAVEGDDGRPQVGFERRPVGPDDLTPFVVVAYCSEHYDISDKDEPEGDGDNGDLEALLAAATKAAVEYFGPLPADLHSSPRAFRVSANCMPSSMTVDDQGNVRTVEGPESDVVATQNVSRCCSPCPCRV